MGSLPSSNGPSRPPNQALKLTRLSGCLLGGPTFGEDHGVRRRSPSPAVQLSAGVRAHHIGGHVPHIIPFLVAALIIGGACATQAGQSEAPQAGQTLPDVPGLVIQAEPNRSEPEALLKCEQLKGYDRVRGIFRIEQAMQGSINRTEESLFVMLATDKGRTLNAAWWLDPIINSKPRYDWQTFLGLFSEADLRLSKHAWLNEWKAATKGRLLELHAFGREPASEQDEIKYSVLPIWREAKFAGRPEFEVLARLGSSSWLSIFFNNKDPRLLVNYSMELPAEPAHWLDSLNVQFHPDCQKGKPSSHYAVVQPDGQWQLHEFSKCAP